jgi:hypothetical protein
METDEASKLVDQLTLRSMQGIADDIKDLLTVDADQVPWGVVTALAEAAANIQDFKTGKLEAENG